MNIALIDKHRIITDTLTSILSEDALVRQINSFTSVEEFMEGLSAIEMPGLIITDFVLPETTGVAKIEKLCALENNCVSVLILSEVTDVYTIKRCMRAGAAGYLSKTTPIAELVEAVQKVQKGELYIGKDLGDKLVRSVFVEEQVYSSLSIREREILSLICEGDATKIISSKLHISIYTVQEHRKNIMRKLKVKRSVDLILLAFQQGFCSFNSMNRS